jgi:hypothetical protein
MTIPDMPPCIDLATAVTATLDGQSVVLDGCEWGVHETAVPGRVEFREWLGDGTYGRILVADVALTHTTAAAAAGGRR